MRDDAGWSELTIHNVSEGGMMLRGAQVPEPGTIIEIRVGEVSIVGQVRWATNGQCGVRSRDRIDVEALLNSSARRAIEQPGRSAGPSAKVRVMEPRALAERSRILGSLIDKGLIVALVVVGAIILVGVVSEMLGRPLRQIQSHLAKPS